MRAFLQNCAIGDDDDEECNGDEQQKDHPMNQQVYTVNSSWECVDEQSITLAPL
jgi:hypothetical protein